MKYTSIIPLFFIVTLLCGCGIPQDKYDAANSEKSALNEQITGMQSEMVKAQRQIKTLRDEIFDLNVRYPALESELSAKVEEIEELKLELPNLKRLFVYKVIFCSDRPDSGKQTPEADNTFKFGETIWVYNEYGGFKSTLFNGKLWTSYRLSFNITDEEGETVNKSTSITNKTHDQPFASWWGSKEYPNLKAGNYVYEITIEDNISREVLTERREFKVIP